TDDQSSVGREKETVGKPLRASPKNSRNENWLRTAGRNLGNPTARASRGLAALDGNFRDPRHDESAARIKGESREVPERKEIEDKRPVDVNRLGLPACRVPQEARIPGGITRLAEVGSAIPFRSPRRARHTIARLLLEMALVLQRLAYSCCCSNAANLWSERRRSN